MSGYTHSGQVYFIACGQYVKIGYTSSTVAVRMKNLRNGRLHGPADLDMTQPMSVLHTIPGCIMRDERRVQDLFAAHHAGGEWFRLTPRFLAQLSRLDYVTDHEVLANFRAERRAMKQRAAARALGSFTERPSVQLELEFAS